MKWVLDRACAIVLLVLLAPVLLLISAIIRLESRGPALFRQERVGRHGRRFRVVKFRTMVAGAEQMGAGPLVAAGDERITRVGHVLRQWSLDELPQLLNVAAGSMSLVGPRPTLSYQVEQYSPRQRRRLEVRPGITGWAQINGRNELTWPERIELDIWYIDHWSLWLDAKILVRTPAQVVSGRSVYTDDMSKFKVRADG
ncbi:MAG: sugar transferase [Gemmatimonadales bacterium]